MSITDDHYKGYWAYFDAKEARRKTHGSLDLFGRPVFRELPIHIIINDAGKKFRSPVTKRLPYFWQHPSYIGKIVS